MTHTHAKLPRALAFVGGGALLLTALLACSSETEDWQKADAQNTIPAYQQFLKEHPNAAQSVQARDRIHALEDEQAWGQAQKTNTVEAYQQYLHDLPNGVHSEESRERITGLQRADAWKTAQADGTAPALEAFLRKYPKGPEADAAHAKLDEIKTHQYRVQLAAYRAAGEAQKARDRLQTKYGKVVHDLVVVPPSPSDKLNLIRSAPMTEEEARAACGTLKKEHQHCEIVKG
jgi:hypothetical protein